MPVGSFISGHFVQKQLKSAEALIQKTTRMSTTKTLKGLKIAVVGVGSVGSTTAYSLLLSGMAAEIVLIDINQEKAVGEYMDLSHASPLSSESQVKVGTYEDCADCAIVIVAGGANQKPGQSRMDLVSINAKIMKDIIPKIAKNAPETILLIATNPVDVLTLIAYKLSGFPAQRVIGSGTLLDSVRFRFNLGKYFDVCSGSVNAFIIGEHGDSEVPAWSLAAIAGMRLTDYCKQSGIKYDKAALHEIYVKTRDAASNIIKRKGYTAYGIATGLTHIVAAILKDEGALLTVSTVGEYYGIKDVALSVPTKVGRNGAHHVAELLLQDDEIAEIRKSAENIKAACKKVGYD